LGSAVGSKLFKADTVGNYTFRYSCWFGSSSGYNQTYYASTEVKVVPSPAECVLKASDTTIFVGDTTTFTWVLKNSVGRADLTNPANSIAWGILPSHQNQSRVFKATKPGTFTFKMEVKNSAGKVNQCTKKVTVAIKPEVIKLTGKDCVITAGKNHCLSEMSWAIKHAAKPNIYNATKNSLLSILAVGTKELKKVNYGNNKIQARDDKQVLDEIIVKATCAEGSDWNGELCGKTKASLTVENCEIGINKSSCMAKLSWEFENADDPKIINIRTGDEISKAIKRENINFKANYRTTRIVAMDGDTTLRQVIVVADCVAGSDWDGSKCSTENQPSAVITVADCKIPHGKSTCQSNMEWEIRNYNNPSIYNKQMANNYKGSTVSGGVVSYDGQQEIQRGDNEIQVRVGSSIITSDTARATCINTAPWDAARGICRNGSLPDSPITIEFSAESDLIRKDDKAKLTWVISDLTGYVCRLSGVGIPTTPINSLRGTIETEPLSSKSLFKINCSSVTFGDTAKDVIVEVVPVVQEV
jgi:plastocyanin